MKRLIVGLSGASGIIYGIRLLEILRGVEEIETHLIISAAAKRTAGRRGILRACHRRPSARILWTA